MENKYEETLRTIKSYKACELCFIYTYQMLTLIVIAAALSRLQFTGLENLIWIPAVIVSAVFVYTLINIQSPNDTDLQRAELAQNLYDLSCQNKTKEEAEAMKEHIKNNN